MDRNLDGIYFRIKRGEKFENICFSDLTEEEKDEIMENKPKVWVDSVAYRLMDVYQECTGVDFSFFYKHLQSQEDFMLLKDFTKMMARILKDLGETLDIVAATEE